MKIRYYLKRKGKSPTHPVFVALYDGEQTELIFTGERIALKDWNAKERQPRDHNGDIFAQIEKVKAQVQKTGRLLQAQDLAVTPYTVKDAYLMAQREKDDSQRAKDRKDKQGAQSISTLAERWTEEQLFGHRPSTQKAIKESIKQFKEFLKVRGQSSIERKELTQEIITAYERYLQEKKKLSNSTHGKRMKHLRSFLKTVDFDVKNIKPRSHKKTIVSLTLEELNALERVEVFTTDHQRAKDLFLLGCYTGQRISDLKGINDSMIVDGEIRLRQVKSGKDVEIPILGPCRFILEKYGNRSPRITEQDLNFSIKEVCKLAGITKLITVEKNVAGLNVSTQVPKYTQISSHISGKTFISLAGPKWGLTPQEIAAIVGKSLKTVLGHYLDLPRESAKQKMIQADAASQMKIAK